MSGLDLLIPVKKYTKADGVFVWPQVPVLAGCSGDAVGLEQLSADLNGLSGIKPKVVFDASSVHTVLVRRGGTGGSESYRLTISDGGVEIESADDAGSYYAIQTLRDILALQGRQMQCCVIEDAPDFKRRGVYHDCSRGKVPKLETLKELVVRLAHWKINELQLYIENTFQFKKHPEIGKGYDPFTPDEILALKDFCRLHHVRLIGSLASLGHMEKILALPQYQHLAELAGFRGFAGGTTLCPTDEGSIKLVDELYSEFVPLFDAVDFNVCGDEPWELGKGRSSGAAEKNGIAQVYLEYMKKLYCLCQKYGRRMNFWSDIVLQYPQTLSQIPKDAAVLNWDYNIDGHHIARTKDIAEAGLSFMVCPGTSSWNTHGSRLHNAIGNVARFAAAGRQYGAEGLLNTDWGDNGHRNLLGVSLHGFAHGAAHAWNGKDVDDKRFADRFYRQLFRQKDDKLSAAMRFLGSTYLTCGAPYQNECGLFFAFTEPIARKASAERSRIQAIDADGAEKVIAGLSGIEWPAGKGLADFEETALQEFAVAAQMDLNAAQKTVIAKHIRSGHPMGLEASRTDQRILQELPERIDGLCSLFTELWLVRNKPSRLEDNLVLFKKVKEDCLNTAGKQGRKKPV